MRNGMKSPAQLARAHIEGANVAGWGRMRFWITATHNNEIVVDHARTGHCDRLRLIVATQVFSQIDPAVFSEARSGLAGLRVERIEEIGDRGKDTTFLAIGPIRQTANRILTFDARIKFPY